MAMPSKLSTPPPLHLPNNFSLSRSPHIFLLHPKTPPSFIPKAASEPNGSSGPESTPDDSKSSENPFESRLSNIRLRYRSGTGKKAELRKSKRGKGSGSGSGSGVFLPPVALKEPVSGGLKVDFGFSPYSERANGRLAGLGLLALVVVELATGKSVISYHTPAIVFIQVYFMAAASAVYLKYEKEKVGVWPNA